MKNYSTFEKINVIIFAVLSVAMLVCAGIAIFKTSF